MIVPQGKKKGLSHYLGNNELFMGKGLSSMMKHMFQFFFISIVISYYIYIGLQHIIGFFLKRATNFQLETFQSEFIYKSYDHTSFKHICPPRNMVTTQGNMVQVVPWGNGSLRHMVGPQGKTCLNCPQEQPCSPREQICLNRLV